MIISRLELDILRCCAGEVVKLPYDAEQSAATERLLRDGLIVNAMEDDQPTCWITAAGEAELLAAGHFPMDKKG